MELELNCASEGSALQYPKISLGESVMTNLGLSFPCGPKMSPLLSMLVNLSSVVTVRYRFLSCIGQPANRKKKTCTPVHMRTHKGNYFQ